MDIKNLYTKYGPMVLRRCRSLLRDEQLAFDAMQEVFMQIIKRRENLDISYPSSLLFTIATNICLNSIRDKKRKHGEEDFDKQLECIACYDDEFNRLELRSLVDHIFKKHAATTRTIATYHYVDGLTLEETAEVCGMSVSGIRKRLAVLSKSLTSLKDFQNETK